MKKIKKLILIILVLTVLLFGAYHTVKVLYPIKYIECIEEYSAEYGIDPYLVMSIIKTESNFDGNAMSDKGASGLMQITRPTAEWIACKLGMEDFSYEKNITDPEINIRMGSYYIAYLAEMYEGDDELAIAAYNAGFNNVDSWLLKEEYSKDGKTLDKIPFPETERYLNKVKNNYRIYKILYKEAV